VGKRLEAWKDLPLRLTKEENLHVTLLFIGFRYDEDIALVAERLRELSPRIEEFDLFLIESCFFPKRGKTRVVSCGTRVPRVRNSWRSTTMSARRSISKTRRARVFVPHITLARVRKENGTRSPKSPISNRPGRRPFPFQAFSFLKASSQRRRLAI
jgi:2'-5' RNA ligase